MKKNLEIDPDAIVPDEIVPDVIKMKGMFTMIAYEQFGLINDYLSLNTLKQYAIRFGTVCKETLKTPMPKDDLLEVQNVWKFHDSSHIYA